MKKRLLALALCLVLTTSLLPITAAAYEGVVIDYVCITGSGFEKDADGAYSLKGDSVVLRGGGVDMSQEARNKCTVGLYQDAELTVPVTEDPAGGGTCYLKYQIHLDLTSVQFDPLNNSNCVLVVDGYSTAFIDCGINNNSKGKDRWIDITFQVTKIHEHNWQFTHTENTLTAKCRNSGCPIQTVDVTLAADSVTLPESPFNARLEGLKQFQQEVPDAVIGEFVYKYKGPGDTEYRVVQPTAANAKAGEYQVGVQISGLPGTVEQEGPVAMAYEGNQDNTGYADLYVQYTAADPAITAQTGDNRPIEIMMVGAAVFSILAAAAFVLDGKRKYRQ